MIFWRESALGGRGIWGVLEGCFKLVGGVGSGSVLCMSEEEGGQWR